MKRNVAVFLLLLTGCFIQAQKTVQGRVVDQQNQPLSFVNVFLKGTTYGTTTDEDGKFAFSVNKKRGVLEISFLGFQTKTVQIKPQTGFLNIVLEEGSNTLDEVLIVTKPKKRLKKEENPAYKILKEIWKRKRKVGLDLVEYYQYKKHTSIEVGLNNLDTSFVKNLFKEQYDEAIREIEYDSDGINYYIPIFIKEQIAQVYGNNKINTIREDIEAEKQEGFSAQGFVFDRMSNTFQNIDVFNNNITILRKSFVSPLSTDGFATYDYVLYDSIVKNNKKLYNIYFFPIRDEDLAFQGHFWVADQNFSIKKIKMKVTKSANLNYVRGLSFEKEFEVKNDSIYTPTKNAYEADFTFLDKNDSNKGLTVKKTVQFKNYLLNKQYLAEFYAVEKMKIRPNQYQRDETYWKTASHQENNSTYKLIKSVKRKKEVKKLTSLINILASGYVPLTDNIQIGSIWTTLSYNEVEGYRTKLGFRTFKTKDDRFRLSGYTAYGFNDQKLKFGLQGQYLLSYKPRITIAGAYQNDVEQLGSVLLNTHQLLDRSFGTNALFSRGNNFFLSNVKRVVANLDYALHPNCHFGFNLTRSKITSASPENFSISYVNDQKDIQSHVINVASDVYLSYTPGRFVYGLGVEQRFGQNIFPTLLINYRYGYKGFLNGTHTYSKVQLKYNQPIVLGKFGLLDATFEGGKVFGKVPVSLLSVVPANQSFALTKNTFALLNYYDYVTDTYATTHFEHHFNGFILNRIPLLRKLKLRSLVTFRAAYGSISDQNRTINDSVINEYGTQNIIYNAPNNTLYYEYGVGLENIGYGNLRFFRIDAIWRSPYTPAPNSIAEPSPKFAIRIAVNPDI